MFWRQITLETSMPLEKVSSTLRSHTDRCPTFRVFPWPFRGQHPLRGQVSHHGFTLWLRPTLIGMNDYGAVLAGAIKQRDGITRVQCTIGPAPILKPILIGWITLALLMIPFGIVLAVMLDSPTRWIGLISAIVVVPLGGLLLSLSARSGFSQRREIVDLVKRLIGATESRETHFGRVNKRVRRASS